MTDDAAFLAAVVARPDDDLPRLVYADWLDERGDADRAAFIRLQCHLAAGPADDPGRAALEARAAELLAGHRGRWVVPDFHGKQEFRRGFIEAVWANADVLTATGERLFAAAPVRDLRVYVLGSRAEPLSRVVGLDRVEALDLSNNAFWAGHQLLTARPFDRLRRLTLRNVSLWADELTALARTPAAARLAALDLSGCPLSDEGGAMDALAGAAGLAGLTTLIASSDGQPRHNCIGETGAAALARSDTLGRLRVLDLSQHVIGDAGLAEFARSPATAALEVLDVSANEVGWRDGGVAAVTRSPHLGRLRVLRLGSGRVRLERRNRLDRRAAEALVGWPRVAAGVVVDLRGCDVEDDARAVMTGSTHAHQFYLDPVAAD